MFGFYGTHVHISGTLTCSITPLAQSTVDLLLQFGTDRSEQIAQTTTDDNGNYAFDVKPAHSEHYSVSYVPPTVNPASPQPGAAGAVCDATSSNWTAVNIASYVIVHVSHSVVHQGTWVMFSGFVVPAQPGLWVHFDMYTYRGWKVVRSIRLDRWSGFHFWYERNGRGWLLFRVVYPQQGSNYLGASHNSTTTWD
ncbi:MAG: hypothetical protein ACYDCC_05935 [Actinomycetota bacterium]